MRVLVIDNYDSFVHNLSQGLAQLGAKCVTRYHSLTVVPEALPEELEITASTESGVIMGMRHRELPVEGVQFHPESVLTAYGYRLLANWMATAGHPVDPVVVDHLDDEMKSLRDMAAAAAVR